MAEVRLSGILKMYGKHTVVKDLGITIRDGECFTFLGPSGCGKTVILRLIAGFERPDEGEITIGGTLVSSPREKIHLPPERRRIGVVFQDYAVWPHKTVFENVIYPLEIQGVNRDEANTRTMAAIDQVNLTGLDRRLPFQLSGGQQQRVALARALVSKPGIMLLDEPLSNLDANLREEMRFEIKELQKNTGVTILYVTHDQEVALAISDRMAIMDRAGAIRQIGTPHEIYEEPADSFIFRFMGIANFIPVDMKNGSACIRGSDSVFESPPRLKTDAPVRLNDLVAGCRPFDIEITKEKTTVKGMIRRMVYLGHMIDYRVRVGDCDLRVQQDIREGIHDDFIFAEGDACHLRFTNLKWFPATGMDEEV